MKKAFFLFAVFFLTANAIFAEPFGLSMGMTLQQVTDACSGERPVRIENDDRYFVKPAKSHSSFKTYIAWISGEYGLYRVRGISDEIVTDDFGAEIKGAFYSFEKRVSAIYGQGEIFDGMAASDSIWKEDSYWCSAMVQGHRKLFSEWHGKNMKDNVSYIQLWTSCKRHYPGYNGFLLIDYEFSNVEKVENQDDEVL